jgi:pimeloyl-ACP methyl ester carboxylesterase
MSTATTGAWPWAVGGLSAVAPELAARLLSRMWFTPPRRALADREREVLSRGTRLDVRVDGRRVAAWSFGEGAPVYFVHGWGGRAGQLSAFVEPLVAAGRRAVLFDGLSHGESDPSVLGARQGSFVDVARCLVAAIEVAGPPSAIVAHSGGAVATAIALATVRAPRLVLVAPMARPLSYAARFEAHLGVDADVARRWRALSERRVGFRWDDLDLTTAPRRLDLPPTLVVHDVADKEVPVVEGRAVAAAWPGAELVETSGLGHQRILRDADVVRRVLAFL